MRFIVRADETLTAFMELESAIRARRIVLTRCPFFSRLGVAKTDLNQAEDILPAGFFASSGPATDRTNPAGKRKDEP
jgi:hypothetical protein